MRKNKTFRVAARIQPFASTASRGCSELMRSITLLRFIFVDVRHYDSVAGRNELRGKNASNIGEAVLVQDLILNLPSEYAL